MMCRMGSCSVQRVDGGSARLVVDSPFFFWRAQSTAAFVVEIDNRSAMDASPRATSKRRMMVGTVVTSAYGDGVTTAVTGRSTAPGPGRPVVMLMTELFVRAMQKVPANTPPA